MPDHGARVRKLRKLIRREKLDCLLVTSFHNVTYLTGFTGDDSYLLVTEDGELLLTDSRFTTQLEEECPGLPLSVRVSGEKMSVRLVEVLRKGKYGRVGVESASMTVGLYNTLAQELKQSELVPAEGLVEQLRMVKDRDELDAIRRACDQARRAFEVVRASLLAPMTEMEIAAELERHSRRFGAKGLSFPPIIAVGPRGALPHANPTSRRVEESDFTLIDWGVNEGLYISDLTRVLVTGKPTPKLRKVYEIVLEAQLAGIAAIRPGARCCDVDAAARKVIEKAGYGKQFGHGLGHGIGLQVHEGPTFAPGQERTLEPGMVVTVEPGIYLPGWGGVRIEDDILVTPHGHEVLTNVPKAWDECAVG